MAPQNMEFVGEMTASYTHKKFNTGYSHKKFGQRKLLRNEKIIKQNDLEINENNTQIEVNIKKSKDIFRPYALDKTETPKKRKFSEITNIHEKNMMAPGKKSITCQIVEQKQCKPQIVAYNVTSLQQQQYQQHVAINKQAYYMMLQRQRAALYMSNLLQFNGNGNGWPTPITNNSC